MAGVDSTEPRFPTPDGLKSYADVSDLIAEHLSVLVDGVQSGDYGDWPLDVDIIKHFHQAFLGPIVPGIAGAWRIKPVRVGSHVPPDHWDIDRLMRQCFDDLRAKVQYAGDDPDLQIEALAFAEANVLHIHPFEDLNGRAVRVLALELVRRFDLPMARAWVEQGPESDEYTAALRAFDLHRSVQPMAEFWLNHRFDLG
jgi:fido (protein-threonine AMPylation protein)